VSFLLFEDKGVSDSGKTRRWVVKNIQNDSMLGWIDWKAAWRKYTFNPAGGTTFDAVCLNEIALFLLAEMEKR